MRVAIIGSGISGATCARMLFEKCVDVEVYEKDLYTGGLVHCSYEEQDILFHRIGGHVFNSRQQSVLDWFWQHFDREQEFVKATRNAGIFLDGKFLGYPIENYVYQLEDSLCRQIVKELLAISSTQSKQSYEYIQEMSFKDFLTSKFGTTLCDIYFYPYNKKIWRNDLDFPVTWLAGKLPMPKVDEIFYSLIMRKAESEMVHSTFYYPRAGGSQFIIDKLLTGINVHKGNSVECIETFGNRLCVNGNSYDAVVYTGDVRKICDMTRRLDIALDTGIEKGLKRLTANQTSNVLCECDKNPFSWIYLPASSLDCHRIIMTGNFSPINNGMSIKSDRTTCTVEFSGVPEKEKMINDIGALPFRMRPIAFNIPKSSYVVQGNSTRKLIKDTKNSLKQKNIFLCGRFAEWEYYNMDAAIDSAMSTCKQVLSMSNPDKS
jgi:protoporphyrinogen oxidase